MKCFSLVCQRTICQKDTTGSTLNCLNVTENTSFAHFVCRKDCTLRYIQGCHAILNWENWEKSGNLKIDQKSLGIWKLTKKSGNFIKLTDWQSPIKQTSYWCWKQNVHSSGLESHAHDFSVNSQKYANYADFHGLKSKYLSSGYHGIPQSLKFLIAKFHKTLECRFWIFGFSD